MSAKKKRKTVNPQNEEKKKGEKLGFKEKRNTPSPECDGVPFLDLEALGLLGRGTGAARWLAGRNHWHVGIKSRHVPFLSRSELGDLFSAFFN